MQRVRFGVFEADLASGELYRDGRRVPLQRQPFRLLQLLIERAGELVTRDELRKQLWPDGTVVDFEHGLNTAVRKLRRALGDASQLGHFVETLPGRGYRLMLAIRTVGNGADAAPAASTCRPELGAPGRTELSELAATLGAELVANPTGEVAAVVAALFVGGSDETFRSARDLGHRIRSAD